MSYKSLKLLYYLEFVEWQRNTVLVIPVPKTELSMNECEWPTLAQRLAEHKRDGLGMKLVLIKVLKKRVK